MSVQRKYPFSGPLKPKNMVWKITGKVVGVDVVRAPKAGEENTEPILFKQTQNLYFRPEQMQET